MIRTVTARVSVLPVVGSELPTDSDAAIVVTEYVDDVRGDTLDTVDEGVGRASVKILRKFGRFCMTSVVS